VAGIIVSGLVVFWDWKIGWRGCRWIMPSNFVCCGLLVMYITAKVMRLSARDYISYFLLGGLFGIVPVLFILFDIVKVDYPSLVSVAASIIFLAAINNFPGRQYKRKNCAKGCIYDAYIRENQFKTKGCTGVFFLI